MNIDRRKRVHHLEICRDDVVRRNTAEGLGCSRAGCGCWPLCSIDAISNSRFAYAWYIREWLATASLCFIYQCRCCCTWCKTCNMKLVRQTVMLCFHKNSPTLSRTPTIYNIVTLSFSSPCHRSMRSQHKLNFSATNGASQIMQLNSREG